MTLTSIPKIPRNLDEVPDEVLFAVDEYHDPAYTGRRKSSGFKATITTDPRHLECAVDNDDFWLQAAAFGSGEVGSNQQHECTYLDALMHQAAKRPRRDGRTGNRGTKTQRNVADHMRRKIGSEA